MKKLKNRKGETLVETLLAVTIMLIAMMCLSVSIVTAQKINAAVKKEDTSFTYSKTNASDGTVRIVIGSDTVSVGAEYYNDNGYIFYTKK